MTEVESLKMQLKLACSHMSDCPFINHGGDMIYKIMDCNNCIYLYRYSIPPNEPKGGFKFGEPVICWMKYFESIVNIHEEDAKL
jgi:hypothetical protein